METDICYTNKVRHLSYDELFHFQIFTPPKLQHIFNPALTSTRIFYCNNPNLETAYISISRKILNYNRYNKILYNSKREQIPFILMEAQNPRH